MSEYNPKQCRASVDMGNIYVCRLQQIPCALHHGERCYMQVADESIEQLGRLLVSEEGEQNGTTDVHQG